MNRFLFLPYIVGRLYLSKNDLIGNESKRGKREGRRKHITSLHYLLVFMVLTFIHKILCPNRSIYTIIWEGGESSLLSRFFHSGLSLCLARIPIRSGYRFFCLLDSHHNFYILPVFFISLFVFCVFFFLFELLLLFFFSLAVRFILKCDCIARL